jgi:thiamine pyrophosphate-dependent acetolactate synthase large subunit-like protein
MNCADLVVSILKREGIDFLLAYPANPIVEAAARADLRTIITRNERTAVHMADAISRVTSGERIGVVLLQFGPGAENAFGAIAQAYSEGIPILVLPASYPRHLQHHPNFSAFRNYQHVTKSVEQVTTPAMVQDAMRRAFTQLRTGRPGPVMVELPLDILLATSDEQRPYTPPRRTRVGPEPAAVAEAARMLVEAQRPVIYAGIGVHWAKAWAALRELAELVEAPVCTSLEGKSSFAEDHPLSLGSGGRAYPKTVRKFLDESDLIFGIGCSFTASEYAVDMPKQKTYIHATLDERDLNKDLESQHQVVGDARLVLEALVEQVRTRLGAPRGRTAETARTIEAVRAEWMSQWMAKLTSVETPLSPYRVLWDLMHTVDVANTIITHDAGSPRDQLSPFWQTVQPMTYTGWGKTTQLGSGFPYTLGAKLAAPDKLCINVWGDAAIGFTGFDLETAARERIPVLSILLNNGGMASGLRMMKVATERFQTTKITGDYTQMARAFGCHAERVTEVAAIVPAIKAAVRKVQEGQPALLEFITSMETACSLFNS